KVERAADPETSPAPLAANTGWNLILNTDDRQFIGSSRDADKGAAGPGRNRRVGRQTADGVSVRQKGERELMMCHAKVGTTGERSGVSRSGDWFGRNDERECMGIEPTESLCQTLQRF